MMIFTRVPGLLFRLLQKKRFSKINRKIQAQSFLSMNQLNNQLHLSFLICLDCCRMAKKSARMRGYVFAGVLSCFMSQAFCKSAADFAIQLKGGLGTCGGTVGSVLSDT